MKILMLHSDHIEWEPKKKAIKSAEDVEKVVNKMEEALVVFSAVEKSDEDNPEQVIDNTVSEIKKNMQQLKVENVVVYPYAHLSPSLSAPDVALKVLKGIEKKLKDSSLNVKRAPFGWYKAFQIKCKGHPLSELSKQIGINKELSVTEKMKIDESAALKKEETLKSNWYVIVPKSKELHPISINNGKIEGYDVSKIDKLEKLVKYEMDKSRIVDKAPPHIELMRKLELVDYEEGSDPGHFRFYPAGKLVKSLLEEFTTREIIEYGGMEVETPLVYDLEHPTLKSYLNRFPARQYQIQTPNKKVFLRFAACFGQFLMMKDAVISYKDLPVRPYEMTRYSFRVEQRGELAGLRRLRAFTMPDCHAMCADFEQAKIEFLKRFETSKKIQEGIGFDSKKDFEFSLRVVKSFYEEHKDFVHEVVDRMGKPALIEIWDERFFYFVFKMEWNFVDALDKAACLTTDQMDVENGERYNITFVDKDGQKKHPIILHLSPTGSIERVMYALLEKEYMRTQAGEKPMLPLWLSPTQVRILPISEKFFSDAHKIADEIEKNNIRVDVDDRNEPIGNKIRKAEKSWVPYIAVLGEKELKEGKLQVRIRENKGEQASLSTQDIIKQVNEKTKGMPFKKLPLNRSLDKRPIFVG